MKTIARNSLIAILYASVGLLLPLQPDAAAVDFGLANLKLPLAVWEVNFNANRVGLPPAGPSKADLEARLTEPLEKWLPLRTYDELSFISRTRQALVLPEAAGLKDQPLLFTWSENAQPHYGPRMRFIVPEALANWGKVWRLSMDVAKGNVAISGGIHLWDIANVEFYEDGTLQVTGVEVSRYAANQPLHLEFLIKVTDKTLTTTVDGKTAAAVTVPWMQPKATRFGMILLHGVLPGGHCEAPSSMAIDNLRLVLEE